MSKSSLPEDLASERALWSTNASSLQFAARPPSTDTVAYRIVNSESYRCICPESSLRACPMPKGLAAARRTCVRMYYGEQRGENGGSTGAAPMADQPTTLPDVTAPKPLVEIERTVSEIGAKVAKARAERGWSLAQLAERAGVSPAAVHKIEKSGMTPTIASLMKVAAALGKSVSYFVDEPTTPDVNVIRGDERARVYTSKQ